MTNTPPTDPDGLAVLYAVSHPPDEVSPADMYNAVQGVRNMSGQNVISQLGAKLDAQAAELRSRNAKLDEQAAKIDAHGSKIDAHGSKIDAQAAKIDAQAVKMDAQAAKMDDQGAELRSRNAKMDAQAAKLDAQAAELRSLKAKVEAQRWMIASILTLLGILTATFIAVATLLFTKSDAPTVTVTETVPGVSAQEAVPVAAPEPESP